MDEAKVMIGASGMKILPVDNLDEAARLALSFDEPALAEICIQGDELTVGVLQGEALPSIRIETPREFYDYRAKYESDRTQYHCPGSGSVLVISIPYS